MNTNLVPTRVTDVNGRSTTVYRKPHTGASVNTSLPSPSAASNPAATNRKLVNLTLRLLGDKNHGTNSGWEKQSKVIRRILLHDGDPEYLRAISELAAMFNDEYKRAPGHPGLYHLSSFLERNDGTDRANLALLHAHMEWLKQHTDDTVHFTFVANALRERGARPDENGKFPTIELHMHAAKHYNKHRHARSAYMLCPSYEYNDEYMKMVEKHADHIDALLAYREERGHESAGMQPEPHDEEDFAQYLSNKALAEGWL